MSMMVLRKLKFRCLTSKFFVPDDIAHQDEHIKTLRSMANLSSYLRLDVDQGVPRISCFTVLTLKLFAVSVCFCRSCNFCFCFSLATGSAMCLLSRAELSWFRCSSFCFSCLGALSWFCSRSWPLD